MPDSDS